MEAHCVPHIKVDFETESLGQMSPPDTGLYSLHPPREESERREEHLGAEGQIRFKHNDIFSLIFLTSRF